MCQICQRFTQAKFYFSVRETDMFLTISNCESIKCLNVNVIEPNPKIKSPCLHLLHQGPLLKFIPHFNLGKKVGLTFNWTLMAKNCFLVLTKYPAFCWQAEEALGHDMASSEKWRQPAPSKYWYSGGHINSWAETATAIWIAFIHYFFSIYTTRNKIFDDMKKFFFQYIIKYFCGPYVN